VITPFSVRAISASPIAGLRRTQSTQSAQSFWSTIIRRNRWDEKR
jgi:hypothetical protein